MGQRPDEHGFKWGSEKQSKSDCRVFLMLFTKVIPIHRSMPPPQQEHNDQPTKPWTAYLFSFCQITAA